MMPGLASTVRALCSIGSMRSYNATQRVLEGLL
jgi:hypothetical protein